MAKDKQITLRLTNEMYKELNKRAEADERTVAEYIRLTLKKALKESETK